MVGAPLGSCSVHNVREKACSAAVLQRAFVFRISLPRLEKICVICETCGLNASQLAGLLVDRLASPHYWLPVTLPRKLSQSSVRSSFASLCLCARPALAVGRTANLKLAIDLFPSVKSVA